MTGSSSLGFMTSNVRSNTAASLDGVIDRQIMSPFSGIDDSIMSGGAREVSKPFTVPTSRRLLTILNLMMALFHSSLAFVTLYFGNLDLEGSLWKSEMNFTRYDNATPPWDLIPTFVQLETGLNLTIFTAVFFMISAFFHLGNVVVWRQFYFSELENCRCPTRFIEYFFSAAVMMLLLGFNAGVRDVMLLIALASLIAITMPFGYWTEVIARPESLDAWSTSFASRIYPYVIGHFPQLVAWGIVVASFYDETDLSRVPDFVHIIIWGELVIFFSFGIVQLVQQLSRPRFYVNGEIAYQILSLTSKGILGGVLLSNVLILSNYNEVFD